MIAYGGIAALLLATVYAPLFHIHADHDGDAALVHAHFPELEISEEENAVHLERPHAEDEARSVDVLTTTVPHAVHYAVIVSTFGGVSEQRPRCGLVAADRPPPHAPPEIRSRIPRSPPSGNLAIV